MDNPGKTLEALGVREPEVLLPAPGVDFRKFAVIACDQYSAEPEYWDETERIVGNSPSALRMMIPEARLADHPDGESVFRAMERYLADGTLQSAGQGFVYVRRSTSSGIRHGLMLALDLEQYDYTPGAGSLIRATEATVKERLPARIAIRRRAALEMPHVMVLTDDRGNEMTALLESEYASLRKLYDFDLMQNGGHIEGYLVSGGALRGKIAAVLQKLLAAGSDGLLFAVGDGNHSLAAAKECWNEIRPGLTEEQRRTHPMRFALVEAISLYDEGLSFHPIHRLLYHVDPQQVQAEVGFDAENPPSLQELQPKLDLWLERHPEAKLEYIHGREECLRLGAMPGRLPIVFGPFPRDTFFETIRTNGIFVRKSFSIGTADEKRFYLECRRLRA